MPQRAAMGVEGEGESSARRTYPIATSACLVIPPWVPPPPFVESPDGVYRPCLPGEIDGHRGGKPGPGIIIDRLSRRIGARDRKGVIFHPILTEWVTGSK